MPHRHSGDLIVPDTNTQVCIQLQIRYACGHSAGGEFIKCQRHIGTEDERCTGRQIQHIDAKNSPHKCRLCLRSE